MGDMMKKMMIAVILAACSVQAQQAGAQETGYAKSGARAELRVTYETPTVSSVVQNGDVYKIGSAIAFGGEVGYDAKVSKNVVVGPYANYEKSSVEACDGLGSCLTVKSNWAAGLHVGYAFGDRTQVYGKLGYASIRMRATSGTISATESSGGPQGAVGLEQTFGKNAYGRLEFGYGDNGAINGLNVQRRHAGVALGFRF